MDFPRVVVDPVRDCGDHLGGDLVEVRPLRDPAPDHLVYVLIAPALVGAIRVTVVALRPGAVAQGAALNSGAVRKLAAVVHGDRAEDPREHVAPLALQRVEGLHYAGRALVRDLGGDLVPGEPLGQHQNGSLPRPAAHYCVHFPVPEGGSLADFLRALFYALALRCAFLFDFVVWPLFVALHREALVCETKENAFFNIAIQGVHADGGGEAQPVGLDFAQHGSGRELVVRDPALDVPSQLVIVADFEIRALRCEVGPVFHFAEVGAIPLFLCPVAVAVSIFAAFQLAVYGGDMHADNLGDLLRCPTVPVVRLNAQPVGFA